MSLGRLVSGCGLVALLAAAPALQAGPGADGSAQGRIHGTVTTHAGSRYTGLIRWGGQEAFWDDLFQSAKLDLPFPAYAEPVEEPVESDWWWQEIGRRLLREVKPGPRRVFAARFGDIARLEVVGGNAAVVTMRSGTSCRVSGYADDVGATLTVTDETEGETAIEWGRVDVVELSPAPAGAVFAGHRLHGTVDAGSRRFTGFIQWDEDEGLSTDRLDGDSEDGRVSIPFGAVAAIEQRSATSARVELADGRALVLDGTNDVNAENRGILVEDPRYGRVRVPWRCFRRIELARPDGSGPGYAEFPKPVRLQGAVTTTDGAAHVGRIHWDLDASESWELLEGVSDGLQFSIPFARVSSLERDGSATIVTLTDGEQLRFDDAEAAAGRPVGVVVEPDGGGEAFLPWPRVRRIDLAW
ncbi:MAG TPA: hypothetical protein PKJ99_01350 [Thermoanaerobaculales bacterium]|nr:hypothetical protein [Thermoanaerobaculales bacterium]HPA79655.1 hypothetical protein [Thermoanaerobaculales bacterium]HQL28976.1 hypothetical protein [Thermoanaerobaculales bacterium]HQN96258.1 hypothetical protein [Thermoanaerobaculales bacterium]HQP42310.1 hypothetical protein [Thermoanaerobaculales bacterium]